ncbi:MAG: ammonium transporter [Novosphingobium sp.]|nr:ammonium transporter [Novosphingobium sp.]MBO9603815.1 ammonium transporter [Novosphingobium sp.]
MIRRVSAALALAATPAGALAQAPHAPAVDSGDTAWILTASAFVLLMCLPGLALFYGGLVRAKNLLSVTLQCGAVAAAASTLWVVLGYTLAFGPSANGWIGGPGLSMFRNLADLRSGTALSENTFALFQMMFAAITPALMVGAWVDRARFSWVVGFCALWGLVVYAPAAHWVWGGGWLAARLGTLDFAGGIVVHTTAGISALVIALLLGRREGFPGTAMLPHAPGLTMIGAMLLWVGWFGFNGGSALTASGSAAGAIVNTHVAACTAALVWVLIERFTFGKPTSVGFATGAIAGLACVTPAAGWISPGAAILFGAASSAVCYRAIHLIKLQLKIDDSLDVFAVHGVGGMLGSVLLGLFLSTGLGGTGYAAGMTMGLQLWAQIAGVLAVAAWSAIATLALALGVSLVAPMRVSREEETEGLDITSHGERGWEFD